MTQQLRFPAFPATPPELPEQLFNAQTDLFHYPAVSSCHLKHYAKSIGAAGEALFDSYMLRLGEQPFAAPESLPFDRLLWRKNSMVRVQIKTCTRMRDGAYHFSITRGYHGGPQGVRPYADDQYDILALVILPLNLIYFTATKSRTVQVIEGMLSALRHSPRASFDTALAQLADARADRPAEPSFVYS